MFGSRGLGTCQIIEPSRTMYTITAAERKEEKPQGSVVATTNTSSTPSNPVPTSMLSFRFATPNNTQTPYYISSDIVLSGGIAQQNRRRIVHNEVEKRRKDKITNWIKKLAELLPKHRVAKQSKNYVLETACEYIKELNDMRTQFDKMKLNKDLLEQEVTELRNKVNKLEQENKRLSQLIHEHKVTLPSTWSDVSVITTTMRATSSSRNTLTSSASDPGRALSQEATVASQARTLVTPDVTQTCSNSSSRLSVTSILSSASNQQTTSSSRHKTYDRVATVGSVSKSSVVSTQSSTIPRTIVYATPTLPAVDTCTNLSRSANVTTTPMSVTRTSNVHRRHNVTADVSALSQITRSPHVTTSANDVTKVTNTGTGTRTATVVQHMFVPQLQTPVASTVPNTQFGSQQTAPNSFERGFNQAQQLRTSAVQDNISQLPYSIDALTGNQTPQNRQSSSHLSSFSAESLIGRQPSSNDIVMINSPANQPVIQNTFTLTHPTTLSNANTSNNAPPQSFSNFSALSLVGGNDSYTASSGSQTRSTTSVPESGMPPSTNHMFTDFSTESLLGPSEFTSDFAIDNLISRSDSNVHMATVNPNLIQSYGKGNDPMISSVSGDHSNHSSHNYDASSLNIGGMFSPHHYPAYWTF